MRSTQRHTSRMVVTGVALAATLQAAPVTAGPGDQSSGHQAAGEPGAVILVDDDRALGEIGDDRLSLAEAIRLANGDLPMTDLSAAERDQVRGRPGPAYADVIRPVVPAIVAEHVDPGPTPGFSHHHIPPSLPVLQGNERDVLDGAGATFSNGAEDLGPIGGLAFLVRSSDLTIRGWRLERFFNMVEVDAPSATGLSDVSIRDNVMYDGGGVYVDGIAADGTRARVQRVVLRGNRFIGPPAVAEGRTHAAVFNLPIHASAVADTDEAWDPTVPGRSRIEGLRVVDNHVRGFSTGGSFLAISASSGGSTAARGDLFDLSIRRNDVELPNGAVDPAFMVWGIARTTGGVAMDARVRNVTLEGNSFRGGTLPFYAAAAENVFGAGSIDGVRWSGLAIRDNVMLSAGACAAGLMVTGAFQELGGGTIRDVRLTGVDVSGNRISGCTSGMLLSPTVFLAGAGASTDVTMARVRVTRNAVDGARDGIAAAGAIVRGNPAVDAEQGTPGATATGNLFRALLIKANTVSSTALAVRLHGGMVVGATGAVVAGNTLMDATVGSNVLTARILCVATADTDGPPAGVTAANTVSARGC